MTGIRCVADVRTWTMLVRGLVLGVIAVSFAVSLVGCGGSNAPAPAGTASSADGQNSANGTSSPGGTGSATASSPTTAGPTLSGTPATAAVVGQAYRFQPTAADPDGRILSFSVQNKPAWAAFNTSTGQLAGTPTAADGGTHSNIVISVSDGAASASLAPFAINVAQSNASSANRVTLRWNPPTQNTNGAAVTGLIGYRIHYGTSPTELNDTVDVNGADVLTYVLNNLASGTWYFAVAAVNSDHVESNLSSIGTFTT